MFGIGSGEIIVLLFIALLVVGPERMPKLARDIGGVLNDLRKTSDELRDEFLNADRVLTEAAAPPAPPAASWAPAALTAAAADPAAEAIDTLAAAESTEAAAPLAAAAAETVFDRELREARERVRRRRQPQPPPEA